MRNISEVHSVHGDSEDSDGAEGTTATTAGDSHLHLLLLTIFSNENNFKVKKIQFQISCRLLLCLMIVFRSFRKVKSKGFFVFFAVIQS